MSAYEYQFWAIKLQDLQKKLKESRKTITDDEYDNIQSEIENAKKKMEQFYPDYKADIYKNCKHISAKIYEHVGMCAYDRDRTYVKCIKCGVDETVLDYDTPEYSDIDVKIMEKYLYKSADPYYGPRVPNGPRIIDMDYDKVKSLYDKMIEENPELTDYIFLTSAVKEIGLSKSYAESYLRICKLHGIDIDKKTGKQRVREDK